VRTNHSTTLPAVLPSELNRTVRIIAQFEGVKPMSNVRSVELKDGQPVERARGILRAPLHRADLDRAAPWLRLLAGLALIAVSTYTTIAGFGQDFAPLLQGTIAGISVALIAGLAAAGFLSLGEWLTSEHAPLIYCALLVLDARYTQQQTGPWVDALAQYHLRAAPAWAAPVVAFVASWGLALAVARYGELLLFGKRRKE
jgi:hypothetical protein